MLDSATSNSPSLPGSDAGVGTDLETDAPSGERPAPSAARGEVPAGPQSPPVGTAPGLTCVACGHAANRPGAGACAACGRFLPGNAAAVTHGARRSLASTDAQAAIAAKREELIAHLGGDASTIQIDLATDYARVDTLIETVAENIERAGLFTGKGRTRAAASMLLTLMERRLRLATTLGLERRVKQLPDISAYMSSRNTEVVK